MDARGEGIESAVTVGDLDLDLDGSLISHAAKKIGRYGRRGRAGGGAGHRIKRNCRVVVRAEVDGKRARHDIDRRVLGVPDSNRRGRGGARDVQTKPHAGGRCGDGIAGLGIDEIAVEIEACRDGIGTGTIREAHTAQAQRQREDQQEGG